MEKMPMREGFKPEKYGMIYCPVCKGFGKSFNEAKGGDVCKICGGFGLIKKEENDFHDNPERV
jgi:rRNA maturation endonuclease Nob1